jgi:hypothetical protein
MIRPKRTTVTVCHCLTTYNMLGNIRTTITAIKAKISQANTSPNMFVTPPFLNNIKV